MDIVIMCAGKGSRLMPLTKDKPKCMVEVKDKPILRHILDNIEESNIEVDNLILVVGYKKEVIHNYLKGYDCPFGLWIIPQNKLDGTANAIFLAKDTITTDTFLVLSGDIIYKPEEIKDLASESNSLLCTTMDKRLYEYGTIDFDDVSGNIRYINEKTTRPTSHYVNCGAYHFTKEVFSYIKDTPVDRRFKEKIITNTINLMIDDGIEFSGIDINNLNEVSYPSDIKEVSEHI